MKLVINIPCYNEARTLPLVLKEMPKKIKGISKIEVQVIDDGSSDGTAEVARKLGVDRVIIHKHNKGLGNAFKTGVDAALEAGCDIFVNTDADNQYPSSYIKDLVKPVLEHKADMVIGDRETSKIRHFSPLKKLFQKFGSYVVRKLSGTDVRDTVSGFRAYSKDALLKLNVISKFSYCIDTIVQAGKKNLTVLDIRIHTNAPTRRSRLFKNMFQHMKKSGANLVRVYVMYEPFKTFFYLSLIFGIPGLLFYLRFLINWFLGGTTGMVQSLLAGTALIIISVIIFCIGILADLNALNRTLAEEQLYMVKKLRYGK